MSRNPEYMKTQRGKTIATKCSICGGALMTPQEFKLAAHERCIENYKNKNYMM